MNQQYTNAHNTNVFKGYDSYPSTLFIHKALKVMIVFVEAPRKRWAVGAKISRVLTTLIRKTENM